MNQIGTFLQQNLNITIPRIGWADVVEIAILVYLIYRIMAWIKKNRAWALLKGILILVAFYAVAYFAEMTVIQQILNTIFSAGLMAVIVIFQPELRKALEQLGRRSFSQTFGVFGQSVREERFSNQTIDALVRASMEMGKARTGALIVIEQEQPLDEYADTGILLDSMVSRQLFLQIFEKNTPLHDGAVIVRENRVLAATCYLPLSNSMSISKDLGTRHRAGLGISEVTDSVTIIVSEETGAVSLAIGGVLTHNIDADTLRNELIVLLQKPDEQETGPFWKRAFGSIGRSKAENAGKTASKERTAETAAKEGRS